MSNDTASERTCQHPYSSLMRIGEPDWKGPDEKTIWYYGRCADCGAVVELEYGYSRAVERPGMEGRL